MARTGRLIGYFTVFSKPLINEEKIFVKKESYKKMIVKKPVTNLLLLILLIFTVYLGLKQKNV